MPITDEAKILEIGREISPVTHVTPDDPPTLIIHGDADKLVPIQQAQMIVEKLKGAGVPAEAGRQAKGKRTAGPTCRPTWSSSPTGSISTWRRSAAN